MPTIADMVGSNKLTGLGIGATGVSTIATLAPGMTGTTGMIIVGVLTLAQIAAQHFQDLAKIKAGLATKPGLTPVMRPSEVLVGYTNGGTSGETGGNGA